MTNDGAPLASGPMPVSRTFAPMGALAIGDGARPVPGRRNGCHHGGLAVKREPRRVKFTCSD
jgi:hypothetical protein